MTEPKNPLTALLPDPKPARRRRGGQPRNTNALRHGLYSAHFLPEELKALDRNVKGDLVDEIALTRIHLLGLSERLKDYKTMPSRVFISITNALSLLMDRLARLTRIHQIVSQKSAQNNVDLAFQDAIDSMKERWKLA